MTRFSELQLAPLSPMPTASFQINIIGSIFTRSQESEKYNERHDIYLSWDNDNMNTLQSLPQISKN